MQMHPDVNNAQSQIGAHMEAIAKLLPPQFRLTLVIRNTIFPDQFHAVISNEDQDVPAEDVANVLMMVDKSRNKGA